MTQANHYYLKAIAISLFIITTLKGYTQDWKTEKRVNVLFGLAQPVLAKGFNIEGNYIHHRFIIDYSHGASLDFSGNFLPKDLRKQQLAIHEPWTTGFGVGYRLKEWINVRVEPKWHKFQFYYDGEPQNSETAITSYRTFSLGLGIYGSYRPFKNKNNFMSGFLIAPSIRYWPTVSSSMAGDTFTYLNKKTGSFEEIKRLDAGTGFTPLVINISVGYSLSVKKKH